MADFTTTTEYITGPNGVPQIRTCFEYDALEFIDDGGGGSYLTDNPNKEWVTVHHKDCITNDIQYPPCECPPSQCDEYSCGFSALIESARTGKQCTGSCGSTMITCEGLYGGTYTKICIGTCNISCGDEPAPTPTETPTNPQPTEEYEEIIETPEVFTENQTYNPPSTPSISLSRTISVTRSVTVSKTCNKWEAPVDSECAPYPNSAFCGIFTVPDGYCNAGSIISYYKPSEAPVEPSNIPVFPPNTNSVTVVIPTPTYDPSSSATIDITISVTRSACQSCGECQVGLIPWVGGMESKTCEKSVINYMPGSTSSNRYATSISQLIGKYVKVVIDNGAGQSFDCAKCYVSDDINALPTPTRNVDPAPVPGTTVPTYSPVCAHYQPSDFDAPYAAFASLCATSFENAPAGAIPIGSGNPSKTLSSDVQGCWAAKFSCKRTFLIPCGGDTRANQVISIDTIPIQEIK